MKSSIQRPHEIGSDHISFVVENRTYSKTSPKKILTDEWLEMDEDQAQGIQIKCLKLAKDEFRTGKKEFTKMHVFALLRKLTQICNFAPGESRSPKTDALSDQVEQIVANGKKVLVYSQYIEEGDCKA